MCFDMLPLAIFFSENSTTLIYTTLIEFFLGVFEEIVPVDISNYS